MISIKKLIKRILRVLQKKINPALKSILDISPASLRRALLGHMPQRSMIRAAYVEKAFHHDPVAAELAYHDFNRGSADFRDNFDPFLIKRAVEFNYVGWPKIIREYVKGKRVLDVGCGTGLHGIGYILVGAASYTGLDPKIALDSDRGKNHRANRYESFGVTPKGIMSRMPRIRLVPGTFEDIAPKETFDLIVLHNVTEHLFNLEDVFEGIRSRLHPEGKVVYHHHNFYCWNGHHLPPRKIDQINFDDPSQLEVIDWNHLSFQPPADHYIRRGLNKIRLDELKKLTASMFDIEVWEEIQQTGDEGANRLTQEIMKNNSGYTERELSVKNVLCVANHKARRQRSNIKGKNMSRERDMRRDEVFMAFYARCSPYTMTSMERLYGLYRAIEYICANKIEGDIVECGVWRGGSMMMAALSLQHFGDYGRQIFMYDTFEGMPEPTQSDYKFGEGQATEKWEKLRRDNGSDWNYAGVQEVRDALRSTNYPHSQQIFIKGLVEETLPQTIPEKIALLRLDTDFYQSTRHELNHLYPLLAKNGVLIIDDYGTWAGSAQATDEYFGEHNILMLLHRLDPGGRIGIKTECAKWEQ